ncbi:choline-sulfatase [Fodinibius roseus]|uniref:Choline-sulfatase n=1 Tax=Fodinibius roseus TaxID=1194090 RepID=A0A1M5KW82_9BACT|nr:sulfatase-like hydrolase/transferase [Fodinibius roseus]SHG56769.1 choline-sulfatase [Fodinibius roseus]
MKSILKALIVLCFLGSTSSVGAQQPPNIVFIFADDLGYHEVGAYGNDEVRTPNIDGLAEQGLQFTRAYNMGSWSPAVCVPSRTMLNTGRYVWEAQKLRKKEYRSWHENQRFWSQRLKQAGYETYFTGKWHVPGLDPHELFDQVMHVRPGMPNQTEAGYDRPHKNKKDEWSPYNRKYEGFWKGGIHWSEVLRNDAVNFIEHASGRESPFFMYLAFNAPHDPRQSPREFVESYNPEELKVPKNFLSEYPYKNPMGAGRVDQGNRPHPPGTSEEEIESSQYLRDERLAPFPRTEYAVRVNRQEYYAIISHLDAQIGFILDELEANGKLDNTIIVFTADHGLAVGQHGLMGKQNMYEHSLRVPFIMNGPGIPAGQKNDTPIYLQDVTPTTIELAGGQVPETYQFQSLLPLIRSEDVQLHPAIYGAYLQHQRAVVEWPYKLILYPDIAEIRLFNLEEDPYEMHDIADLAKSEPIIRRLMQRLANLQNETGDELDLSESYSGWF